MLANSIAVAALFTSFILTYSCPMVQFSFKLHNGKHIIKDTDKVTLAFYSEEEARLWHTTFQSVIRDIAAKSAPEVSFLRLVTA